MALVRLASGDPRLSLEERYGTRAGFVSAICKAATALVAERFMLDDDAVAWIDAAKNSDVLDAARGLGRTHQRDFQHRGFMTRFCFIAPAAIILLAVTALASSAAADPQGQAAAGGALFKQRCAACHSVTPGQKGVLAPNLAGVLGRKAASADFNYSTALKASGLTWSAANLDRFLSGPMKMVPGTHMVISISDPADRANVIAWLATQH